MSDKIKPCPFCGGEKCYVSNPPMETSGYETHEEAEAAWDSDDWVVICDNDDCGAVGPLVTGPIREVRDRVISLWNNRVSDKDNGLTPETEDPAIYDEAFERAMKAQRDGW